MTKKAQKSITQAKIIPLDRRRRTKKGGRRPPSPPLPRYLTQEELGRFRKAVHAGGNPRDIILFGLMYRFGLRAIEVTRLLVEDVEVSRRRIRIRRAKGGDPKEYPLPQDLVGLLR